VKNTPVNLLFGSSRILQVIDLAVLMVFLAMAALWVDFNRVWAPRAAEFQSFSDTVLDLYTPTRRVQIVVQLGSFSLLWVYFRSFRSLTLFSIMNMVSRTLSRAVEELLPFAFVFLMIIVGFALSSTWVFGIQIEQFRTFWRSFATVWQCMMTGGLPLEDMQRFRPIFVMPFLCVWTVLVALVLINVFIATLSDKQARIEQDGENEMTILAATTGRSGRVGWLEGTLRGYWAKFRKASLSDGGEDTESQEAGATNKASERLVKSRNIFDRQADIDVMRAQKAISEVDLKEIGFVREALLRKRKLRPADLTPLFRGDVQAAEELAEKMCDLEEAQQQESSGNGDQEAKEQERLKKLHDTVQALESQVKRLRKGLHNSGIAKKGTENQPAILPNLPGAVEVETRLEQYAHHDTTQK